MKYLLSGVLGALCGLVVALGLLYVNPLLGPGRGAAAEPAWTLRYTLPLPDPALYADGGLLGLSPRPAADAELWEATIRRTAVGLYALQGADAVVASRISLPHRASDFALDGPLLTDYWLLTVPGRGTVFLRQDSNVWPFLRDVWFPARLLQRPWQGPARVLHPTVRDASELGVVGVDGAFAGRRGVSSARYEIASLVPGAERVHGELQIAWQEDLEPASAAARLPAGD